MWDILHYWYSDPEFLDSTGNPARLPFSGDSRSFSALVRRFGGDIPPGAMRTELKRVGAIEEVEGGNLRVLKRTFRPEGDHDSLVASLVHGVYPLIATVSHNTDPNRVGPTWTQRIAFTRSVNQTDVPRLKRIAGDRIAAFAESVDDLFMAFEAPKEEEIDELDKATIAVGVFYFEDRETDKKYQW
jgi:hypothetical protein